MKDLFDRKPLPASNDEPMQTGRVFLLALAHFLNDTYNGFVAPLLPILMTRIGFGLTLAAALTSIQAVFNSLSQPLFGHFADKMKRPYMTILGPLVTAVFLGSIGLCKSYLAIVVVLIFSGLGTAAFHPQASVFASRASGNRKGLGMSIFVTGGSAGHSLGPIIILPIVTMLGLQYSTLTIFYGLVISLLVFIFIPPLATAPKHVPPLKMTIKTKHRNFVLFLLWIIVTIRAFIIVAFITFIPIYLHNKNLPLLLSGSAITFFELSGAAGALFGGAASDYFGRRNVIFLSVVLSLPFLWLFLYSNGFLSFLALALSGVILYSSIPVNIVMAQELFPNKANTVSSVMMGLAWGIGGLFVTPLGSLAERIGIGSALNLVVFVGIFAALAALMLPRIRREYVSVNNP